MLLLLFQRLTWSAPSRLQRDTVDDRNSKWRKRQTDSDTYECDPDIVTLSLWQCPQEKSVTSVKNWNCTELQRKPSAAQRKKEQLGFLTEMVRMGHVHTSVKFSLKPKGSK